MKNALLQLRSIFDFETKKKKLEKLNIEINNKDFWNNPQNAQKVSIEASTTDYWRKYIGENGMAFGIDSFGKSAPYKEIYEHFGLTSKNIVKKVKEMINNKT